MHVCGALHTLDPPYPLPGPINNAGASSSSTNAVREAIKAEKKKKKNYDRRQALKARKEPKAHAPKGQTPLPSSAPATADVPEQHRVAIVSRMEAIKAVWRRVPDNIGVLFRGKSVDKCYNYHDSQSGATSSSYRSHPRKDIFAKAASAFSHQDCSHY